MPTQIGELFVKIGADVSSFMAGLTKGGDGLKGFSARLKSDIESGNLSIQSLGANMLKAAGPAGVMAGAVAGLGVAAYLAGSKVYDFTMKVETAKDNLADLGSEAGLSIETMSGLQLVAMKSGMSIDELAGSFKFLGKAVIAAGDDTSKQAETFRNLGISLKDSSGNIKDSVTLFKELATVISKMPDGFQKSTIEMELFGRSGVKLNEILNKGGEALDAEIKRGQELAGVTKEDADEAQRLIDANAELTLAWTGMKNQLAGGLTPALIDAIKYTTYFIEECRNSGDAWEEVRKGIDNGTISVWSQVGAISTIIQLYKDWIALKNNPILAGAAVIAYGQGKYNQYKHPGEALQNETEDLLTPEANVTQMTPAQIAAYRKANPKIKPGGNPPGGTGGDGSRGKTPAEIAKEEHDALVLQQAEWTAQNNKDIDAEFQFKQNQASLEIEASIAADQEELDRMKAQNDAKWNLEKEYNERSLAEKSLWADTWKEMSTAAFAGTAEVLTDTLVKMVHGAKVTGKEFVKAMGAMFGGVIIQKGTSVLEQGIGDMAIGAAMEFIPGMKVLGAGLLQAGAYESLIGGGMVAVGAAMGGGGSAGGGGGKNKGGNPGHLKNKPEDTPGTTDGAVGGGTATINIVGGDEAIFSGKQVRALVEQINEQTAKGMTLRFA